MDKSKKIVWERKVENIFCNIDSNKKSISFEGPIGKSIQVYDGEDIIIKKNKVLIKTKESLGYFF